MVWSGLVLKMFAGKSLLIKVKVVVKVTHHRVADCPRKGHWIAGDELVSRKLSPRKREVGGGAEFESGAEVASRHSLLFLEIREQNRTQLHIKRIIKIISVNNYRI